MDQVNPAHRPRDEDDAVTETTAVGPAHQPRDGGDAVTGVTAAIHPRRHHRGDQPDGAAIHPHRRHRDDQTDGAAIPGGANREERAGQTIDPSAASVERPIGGGA